ncbi:tRNA (adenosine(37)-N6)-threonylcarbamoyltransferase complex ATPase subunit type 1 TsaE [Patescibacteria group bacterium]|nr:tRNA (adenosine(37)-N6)-threonylcarbamoyltransferase complex ATPase subunit type 1 TsaE [Patescibacteria group bacterium]
MIIDVTDISRMRKFAAKMAKNLRGGDIVAMQGEIGAGKTTLAKLILQSAGVKTSVSSPTFTIMARHRANKLDFYHLDLYRLKNYHDAYALGLEELWGRKQNVFLIEWADKIKASLPKKSIILDFKINGRQRKIIIKNGRKNFQI